MIFSTYSIEVYYCIVIVNYKRNSLKAGTYTRFNSHKSLSCSISRIYHKSPKTLRSPRVLWWVYSHKSRLTLFWTYFYVIWRIHETHNNACMHVYFYVNSKLFTRYESFHLQDPLRKGLLLTGLTYEKTRKWLEISLCSSVSNDKENNKN